jgi:hypothetical protein
MVDKVELEKMEKIRTRLVVSLASQNISFHPPRNNKRNLIKNNPNGYKLLLEYLEVEANIESLNGNDARSQEVRGYLTEALEAYDRVMGENNGD